MFDRLTRVEKTIAILGGIVVPAGLVRGGAASYGRLQADVETLQREVAELRKPVSSKGDLCGVLVEEFALAVRTRSTDSLKPLLDQMNQMQCSDFTTETSWAAEPSDGPAQ